jgi:condensin complex subunit 2
LFVLYLQDDDDDNEVGFDVTASQDVAGSQDVTQLGDKLVTARAPRKVAQLDINYAKQAKKMDVKTLKGSMWNLLVKPEKDKVRRNRYGIPLSQLS